MDSPKKTRRKWPLIEHFLYDFPLNNITNVKINDCYYIFFIFASMMSLYNVIYIYILIYIFYSPPSLTLHLKENNTNFKSRSKYYNILSRQNIPPTLRKKIFKDLSHDILLSIFSKIQGPTKTLSSRL